MAINNVRLQSHIIYPSRLHKVDIPEKVLVTQPRIAIMHHTSTKSNASVMELVDMTDSKSVAFGRGGSSPPTGTIISLCGKNNKPTF